MRLFDWFEPDPPVYCLKCTIGTVHGWQGKHSGHALWRQGTASPIDQLVDDECKIDGSAKAMKRLPQNEEVPVYHGACNGCGATFPDHLDLAFTGDTCTELAKAGCIRQGLAIETGWHQCPECLDAYQLEEDSFEMVCINCDLLLFQPNAEQSAEGERSSADAPERSLT